VGRVRVNFGFSVNVIVDDVIALSLSLSLVCFETIDIFVDSSVSQGGNIITHGSMIDSE